MMALPEKEDPMDANSTNKAIINPDLMAILRCPLTHSKLRQEGSWLAAEVGGLRYPIRDGIPVMLIEEAILPSGIESLEAFKSRFGDAIGPATDPK
jgi:uncharacterized protein YbaR (Trm112 family)